MINLRHKYKKNNPAVDSGQLIFVTMAFIVSYLLAVNNIELFEMSQDFNANKFMVATEGYGLTKGFFYFTYRTVFSYFLTEEQYLVAIWSVIPAGAIASFFIISSDMRLFKSPVGLLMLLIAQFLIYYLFVLRFIIHGLMIPTGHLLFQSAASILILIAILTSHKSKFLFYVFGVLAVGLHYSAVIYMLVSIIYNKISRVGLMKKNFILSSVGLKNKTIGILLLTLFLVVFNLAAEAIRGYGEDDSLGVDGTLLMVVFLSLGITSLALVILRAYSKMRRFDGGNNLGDINFLFKSMFAISFISTLMIIFHQGLAYRLNYIVYVVSPVILLTSLIMVIKILLKK